jgi:hypothetical protein
MDSAQQQRLDSYRVLNRYDERNAEWPSSEVFEPPRRTLANGWMKFHADRNCGSGNLRFIEQTTTPVSEKYEYKIYCPACGHEVPEQEILFIGGDWYRENGWKTYGRPLDELTISEDRILSLGPNPDQDELMRILNLCRIERQGSSLLSLPGADPQRFECDDCEKEALLTYDGRCRMCYDGEWTQNMTDELEQVVRIIKERNGSFRHRLPTKLTPSSFNSLIPKNLILWRRASEGPPSKLVVVSRRLEDYDSGQMEYIVSSPDEHYSWRYTQDEIDSQFWSTELYNQQSGFASLCDEELISLWKRLSDSAV